MKNKSQTIKRVLSLVMAFAMILTLMPTVAFAAETKTIYLKAGVWDTDNAWFDAWVWGSTQADAWYTFADTDGDLVYETEIPSDATGMIVVRKDPNSSSHDWNKIWNQTVDLTISSSYNCYNVTDWAAGNWSTYDPSTASVSFTVAGDAGLCDSEWDVTATANDMTKNAAGLYEKVYTNVAAGTYEFKVAANHSWDKSWGDTSTSNGNASVTVAEAGSTVTITFDAVTKVVTAEVTEPSDPEPSDPEGSEPESSEPESSEPGTSDTVTYEATFHFADALGWGTVNLYTWTDAGTHSGSWPGSSIAKGDDGFYSTTISYEGPAGEGLNFIFNNGGTQTVNLAVAAKDFVDNKVEKWVILTTADSEGKYSANILDSGDSIAVSPLVNDKSVTFQYKNASATSVSVYGSWNEWASGTAMTKNANDIWTVTLNDLEPGSYGYKFVVGEDWIADPMNPGAGTDGNSSFLILDPNAVDNNEVTINFYYNRTDGIYETTVDGTEAVWNAYIWGDSIDAIRGDFEKDADGNMVTSITVDGRKTQYVNMKTRLSTAAKDWVQEESQVSVNLSDIVSGTINVYVNSTCSGGNAGTLTYNTVLGADLVKDNKVTDVQLDYTNGTVAVTTYQAITDPAAELKLVKEGEEIAVTITASGSTYTMTMPEGVELDLVDLYQYEVTYDGYSYAIGIDNVYATDKFAEDYTYTDIDKELGATWTAESTTFKVWAPTAAAVSVNLYESGTEGTNDLIKSVPMTADANGTWTVSVEGDLNGTYYTYAVTVDGETVEAVDPYARTTGVNGNRGMVIDLDSTDPDGWDEDENPNPVTSQTDAVIYELHVRDFSIDDSSGVSEANRGKYLAFTETGTTTANGVSTGIDYLKELGITHLHLLPVYDYGSVDETKCDSFNWGYDPKNYNTPEGSYSTNPYDGATRVSEFKQMVKSLHDNGISVVMDVVYNHVYDASTFCFNQIVPGYFSRVNSNRSGCGNDTASEREMVRKYIVESVLYWTEEYHIDGFRFDLVGLLDAQTINQIVTEVHAIRPDVIFYGEGWEMDGTNREPNTEMAKQGNAYLTPGFGYFSDDMRNLLGGDDGKTIGFVSGATGCEANVVSNFMAKPWWSNNPQQVIQYASCHDNYTLIDKIITSTGASSINANIMKMSNLAAAVYMTAQGVPFIHAGEEFFREKLDVNGDRIGNSYNASDYVNHIEWSNLEKDDYAASVEYYQGLIAFRKAHPALSLDNAADIQKSVKSNTASGNVVAIAIDGYYAEDTDDIFVIFNANTSAKTVSLPDGEWTINVQGNKAGTASLGTASGSVSVDAISAMVLTKTDEGADAAGSENSHDAPPSGYKTIYFTNNQNWSNVYAYAWNAGGPVNGSWPGSLMTYLETNNYGQDIYYAFISTSAANIIFNNGSAQTDDLTCGVDGTGYYIDDSGKCVSYEYREPVTSGSTGGSSDYYLQGYINGANYGCDEDYANLGEYKFVDGTLTTTFETDSYVGVKTGDNATWYMTDGWLGGVTSATLYDTAKYTDISVFDKLMVPGGVEVTFTLTVNEDDTVTLSYEAAASGVVDASGIQDGVTLHCWNWSFANIEANMAKIAEQGYTAIQTSPVQLMKEDTVGQTVGSHWWVYYQPVDFVITTDDGSALGTKTELESMIETAHRYGIQVIVDVVANHLGNKTGNDLSDAVPDYLRNDDYWHDITTNITSWNDRENMTQYCLDGLPDLNTANDDIQGYVLNFLKECVDIGVDGFRFDMAKSIETPDDDESFASDFWPTVINGVQEYAGDKDLYIYGEVLDDPKIAISAYTKYMAVTDNSWGNSLRGNIASGTASITAGYNKAADASQLVIWAESHDTYATDDATQNSSGVSEANINKTWALVAARADAMGLYLARPESLTQELGVASETGWANDEVKAVNAFHNAFVGQSETVGTSGSIAYVVRGTTGVVLVNASGTTATVSNLSVGMTDGTYTDQITGNTFAVADGKISGSIGDTGIAVVYNSDLFTLAGANVKLEDAMDMYFYVDRADLEDGEAYYAEIIRASVNDDEAETVKISSDLWEAYSDDMLRFAYTDLPARAMADTLTVTIYKADGTQASHIWNDSIQEYAMRMLEKNPDNANLCTVLVDMLNYGAAAQTYFEYNAANLANADLTETQKAWATQNVTYADNRVVPENDTYYYGSTISLKSELMLTMYFQNITSDMYAKYSYTDCYGDEQIAKVEYADFYQTGSYVGVDITGVAPSDGAALITCTVFNDDGTEAVTVQDSIASYLTRMQGKADIYEYVMKFVTSANAYFESLAQ